MRRLRRRSGALWRMLRRTEGWVALLGMCSTAAVSSKCVHILQVLAV